MECQESEYNNQRKQSQGQRKRFHLYFYLSFTIIIPFSSPLIPLLKPSSSSSSSSSLHQILSRRFPARACVQDMKGLFKPKPRTPMELVLQTRDLLIFLDQNTETRERKREEKVRSVCTDYSFFLSFFRSISYGKLIMMSRCLSWANRFWRWG